MDLASIGVGGPEVDLSKSLVDKEKEVSDFEEKTDVRCLPDDVDNSPEVEGDSPEEDENLPDITDVESASLDADSREKTESESEDEVDRCGSRDGSGLNEVLAEMNVVDLPETDATELTSRFGTNSTFVEKRWRAVEKVDEVRPPLFLSVS